MRGTLSLKSILTKKCILFSWLPLVHLSDDRLFLGLFQCLTAASLLKHKLDTEASLNLAKKHLNFDCKEDAVDDMNVKLRDLEGKFLSLTGNSNLTVSLKVSESSYRDKKKQWRKLLEMKLESKNNIKKDWDQRGLFGTMAQIRVEAYINTHTVMTNEKLKDFNSEYDKRLIDPQEIFKLIWRYVPLHRISCLIDPQGSLHLVILLLSLRLLLTTWCAWMLIGDRQLFLGLQHTWSFLHLASFCYIFLQHSLLYHYVFSYFLTIKSFLPLLIPRGKSWFWHHGWISW